MSGGRRLGAIALVVVGVVAACTAATPTRPAASRASAPASVGGEMPSPEPSAPAGGTPSQPASDGSLGDLGALLDVRSVDHEFTSRVLEFASTGFGIVASAAEERGDQWAPDLYVIPTQTGTPELVWRNPERDHSLVRLAADGHSIAFVDMPITGEAEWTLYFIPEQGSEPIVLDRLVVDPDVPSLVPSMSVYYPYVAWTAFDRGPNGTVSQLLYARAPTWEPTLYAERPASESELWFPSLFGAQLAYTELTYADDHLSDERHVWLGQLESLEARQLDTSGLATMPVMNQYDIAWKEGERGFHQLNWGSMTLLDEGTGGPVPMPMWHQDEVNYPSAGTRFMTWWSVDSTVLAVWDASAGEARGIVDYEDPAMRIRRPHVAGSLITWLFVDDSGDSEVAELRYALLPG